MFLLVSASGPISTGRNSSAGMDTAPVYEQGYLQKVLPFAPGPSGLYLAANVLINQLPGKKP